MYAYAVDQKFQYQANNEPKVEVKMIIKHIKEPNYRLIIE